MILSIGIDGYEANTQHRVGIGQYAFQLLHAVTNLDTENQYTIYLPQPPRSDFPKESSSWKYVVGKPGQLWTILQLPKLIDKKHNVFFSPTHYAPWFTPIPKVLSVMDLSYLHFPQMFRRKDLYQLKYMGGYSISRAAKILTISEFSKNEIISRYHKNINDVVVTYPGLSPALSSKLSPAESKHVVKKYGISKDYLLFVGTLQPRKNITRLIEAYDSLDTDVYLVLIGKKGWLYEPILKAIKNAKKSAKIKLLDFVSTDDLPAFYQETSCFVLPSLYEGFGLPVLEALRYGCPVVVSHTSSLPEVAGQAGIYVDPVDTRSIANGITKALQLQGGEKEELRVKALEQIEKFQWSICAQKTIAVFKECGKI